MRKPALNLSTFALGAAIAWFASSHIDAELRFDPNGGQARALDLFGSDEKKSDAKAETSGELEWRQGSDAEPIIPVGVPSSFADLAEKVSPAVVNIRTKAEAPTRRHRPVHPLEELFRMPMPRGGGVGSGFVLNGDGYIVTNEHVVRGATSIEVEFSNGDKYDAVVVGADKKTDIALILVEGAEDLTSIPLGDSDEVRPGEWVVAIGNPFELDHTVTAGIVSAKHRSLHGPYDDFIQTDAAINPGSSGGPLVNLKGEVIGINSAIREGANTVGFTIPINMAKQILPQLHASGIVQRGWLGVVIQSLTPELAENFGLDERDGALINDVAPDGPAQRGGLRRGDVIVEFDGEKIEAMNELPRVVANTRVGSEVDVIVVRKGKRTTLDVTLGEMPGEDGILPASAPSRSQLGGLRLQPLTAELADRLGVEDSEGVLVSEVDPGTDRQVVDADGRQLFVLDSNGVRTIDLESVVQSTLPQSGVLPTQLRAWAWAIDDGGQLFAAAQHRRNEPDTGSVVRPWLTLDEGAGTWATLAAEAPVDLITPLGSNDDAAATAHPGTGDVWVWQSDGAGSRLARPALYRVAAGGGSAERIDLTGGPDRRMRVATLRRGARWYFAGGIDRRDASFTPLDEVWVLDLDAREWAMVAHLPEGRESMALAFGDDGALWAIGGRGEGGAELTDAFRVDTVSGEVLRVTPTGTAPSIIDGTRSWTVGGRLVGLDADDWVVWRPRRFHMLTLSGSEATWEGPCGTLDVGLAGTNQRAVRDHSTFLTLSDQSVFRLDL